MCFGDENCSLISAAAAAAASKYAVVEISLPLGSVELLCSLFAAAVL
jgi:hypothetical protein